MYADEDGSDCEDIPLEDIHAYYGTTANAPRHQRPGQTGAGHDPEEESSSGEEDEEDEGGAELQDIAASQAANLRHPGVPVPDNSNPFADEDDFDHFAAALEALCSQCFLPGGYGVRPDEQEGGGFQEIEVIRSGRRGQKELEVALPEAIWRPRTELWAQGLHVMNGIVFDYE